MIWTAPCSQGQHEYCEGRGLVQGILRPNHEPEALGELRWVTVACDCPCHRERTTNRTPDLLDAQRERASNPNPPLEGV